VKHARLLSCRCPRTGHAFRAHARSERDFDKCGDCHCTLSHRDMEVWLHLIVPLRKRPRSWTTIRSARRTQRCASAILPPVAAAEWSVAVGDIGPPRGGCPGTREAPVTLPRGASPSACLSPTLGSKTGRRYPRVAHSAVERAETSVSLPPGWFHVKHTRSA
jgi:hypothetical protein